MPKAEAENVVVQIRANLTNARKLLLDLYQREGWRALGYDSWRACVTAEFDASQSHVYRELAAAQVELNISQIGNSGSLPQSHAQELVNLPPILQQLVYDTARENGPITAAGLAKLVSQLTPEQQAAIIRDQEEQVAGEDEEAPAVKPINYVRRLTNAEKVLHLVATTHADLATRYGPRITAAVELFEELAKELVK